MFLIKNLLSVKEEMSIVMRIDDCHVVELFEIEKDLKQCGCDSCKNVFITREGNMFVLNYRPRTKVLLRICSNPINEN